MNFNFNPENLQHEHTIEIEGKPLVTEHLIIGALVKRLGNNVTLTVNEISAIKGLVITPIEENVSVQIEAQTHE